MSSNSWKLFIAIISNLTAILFIYLFFKYLYKKRKEIAKGTIAENKNIDKSKTTIAANKINKKFEMSKNLTTCPFMAAFNNAKKMESAKRTSQSINALSSESEIRPTESKTINQKENLLIEKDHVTSLNIDITRDKSSNDVVSKDMKTIEPKAENTKEATNNQINENEQLNNKLSNIKKVSSPEEIKSFYEHIPAHVKQLEQEKLMMTLKPEEREEEAKVRKMQLEQIYKLMGEKSDLFGISSFDDIHDQMKLYVQ